MVKDIITIDANRNIHEFLHSRLNEFDKRFLPDKFVKDYWEGNLKYDSDWNEFMKAWRKLKKIYDEFCISLDWFSREQKFVALKMAITNADIKRAFILLDTEIKWLNENPNIWNIKK